VLSLYTHTPSPRSLSHFSSLKFCLSSVCTLLCRNVNGEYLFSALLGQTASCWNFDSFLQSWFVWWWSLSRSYLDEDSFLLNLFPVQLASVVVDGFGNWMSLYQIWMRSSRNCPLLVLSFPVSDILMWCIKRFLRVTRLLMVMVIYWDSSCSRSQ
jgi:hypothetical protein